MDILDKYRSEIKCSQTQLKSNTYLGFNFFSSISDYYYRENFHSDIFKTLLSIPEFFESFFQELSSYKRQIIQFDINNTIVEREKYGRIDISIIDHSQNNAIIVENIVNDA